MNIPISETIVSIQNIGISAGMPALIIELSENSKNIDIQEHFKCLEEYQQISRVIITGDEPLKYIKEVKSLIKQLDSIFNYTPFIELDTTGTIDPTELLEYVNQWNVNIEFPIITRNINKQAISILAHYHSQYIFYISRESQINEIFENYSFLPKRKFILFPKNGFEQNNTSIVEQLSMKYDLRMSYSI